jgi:hypothetical protein
MGLQKLRHGDENKLARRCGRLFGRHRATVETLHRQTGLHLFSRDAHLALSDKHAGIGKEFLAASRSSLWALGSPILEMAQTYRRQRLWVATKLNDDQPPAALNHLCSPGWLCAATDRCRLGAGVAEVSGFVGLQDSAKTEAERPIL